MLLLVAGLLVGYPVLWLGTSSVMVLWLLYRVMVS